MWKLDHKEGWVSKNWCFWTVVLEKTLESPLDCKEIKPVNPKGNQPWIFIERTDAEAANLILWPPDEKKWLIGKDPDSRKDWRQEEKGMTGRTWVWESSGKWWKTGMPRVLQSMGSQRIGHDRVTEQIHWKDWCWSWSSNNLATDEKSWLPGKVPGTGKDWGQEEKGMTEDEMVGWHHWFNGHEFEQALGQMVKDKEAWCVAVHGVSKSGHELGTKQQVT